MAFSAKDGSKHTNYSSMKHADAKFGAAKPMVTEPEDGEEQAEGEQPELEPHQAEIHNHLRNMHAQTGEKHSHIEHHGDGSHTSHYVDEGGEVHGPHDHANMEALKQHMDQFLGEEQHEGEKPEPEGY